MFITFTFTRIAVIVRRWFEISPEAVMEHGARVELRLLDPQPHRGSDSAAQRTVLDVAFWRADLFNRLDRPDASFSAAHYHPHFDGVEPSDRVWDTELTADPWAWLAARLSDVGGLLTGAGLDASIAADDIDDIRGFVPQIVTAARQFSPEDPMTRDRDFHLTRDAAERVRLMLAHIPSDRPVDHDYVRPWVRQP